MFFFLFSMWFPSCSLCCPLDPCSPKPRRQGSSTTAALITFSAAHESMHPHSEDSAIHHGGPSAAHICVFFLKSQANSFRNAGFFLIVLIKQPYFLNTLLQLDPGASVFSKAFFCHFLLQQLCSFTLDRAPVRILSDGFWFLFCFFSKNHTVLFINPDETIIIFFVWLLRSFVKLWDESQERHFLVF